MSETFQVLMQRKLTSGSDVQVNHTAGTMQLAVGDAVCYEVAFRPKEPQHHEATLVIYVEDNEYESTTIAALGEGFTNDISIENVRSPASCEVVDSDSLEILRANTINFGDCCIGEQVLGALAVVNYFASDSVRFQWSDHPLVKFSPHTGHLHPGCSKDIMVLFKADEPKTLVTEKLQCKTNKITFPVAIDEVADWDDSHKIVKWVETSGAVSSAGDKSDTSRVTSAVPPVKHRVVEIEPEPVYTPKDSDPPRTVELLVSAVADYCAFGCRVDKIAFRDTLVLQTRKYNFILENTGNVELSYNWLVTLNTEHHGCPISQQSVRQPSLHTEQPLSQTRPASTPQHEMDSGSQHRPATPRVASTLNCQSFNPFSIEPQSGLVKAGDSASFTASFSPLDIGSFVTTAECRYIPHVS